MATDPENTTPPIYHPRQPGTFREQYRNLTPTQSNAIEEIKGLSSSLHVRLESVSDPRMKAIAKTKLEECVMWAVKGITG